MLDLRDVTFTIPLRYDTDDRVLIFNAVMTYICRNVLTNIIICESDKTPKFQELSKSFPNCKYMFEYTDSDIFHRTKLLNKMYLESKTPYISNNDIDCIVPLSKYIETIEMLRTRQADFVNPFDSYTWNVPKHLQQKMIREGNIDWLSTNMCLCANEKDIAMGGIVFFNKEKFIKIGLENEMEIGWSPDDQDRIYRVQKLGLVYKRIAGPLFHLHHRRLMNSGPHHRFMDQNEKEFEKIKSMTKEELENYIKTWNWVPK